MKKLLIGAVLLLRLAAGTAEPALAQAPAGPVEYPAVPNCLDSGGAHLNYNAATGQIICGTSGGVAAGVSTFNTRAGAVTLQTSDLTGLLGYTPGPGTLTGLTAGSGMTGGGASGTVTLGLAPIGGYTVLGNPTGSSAAPTALSEAQLTALIVPFSSGLSGAVPASGGGVTNFLRSDGVWATPPGTSLAGVAAGAGLAGGGSSGTVTVSLAAIANNSVLGNVSGSSAAPGGLTQAQLTGLVLPFGPSQAGIVPGSGGGTTAFLRADGTWVTPAGGGTITGVTVGNGLTGGGTSGTVTIGCAQFGSSSNGCVAGSGGGTTNFLRADGVWAIPPGSSSGTITGVTVGNGLTGGGTSGNVTIGCAQFGSSSNGCVAGSGGGTTNFLRADGVWAVPPGSGGGSLTLENAGSSLGTVTTLNTAKTLIATAASGTGKLIPREGNTPGRPALTAFSPFNQNAAYSQTDLTNGPIVLSSQNESCCTLRGISQTALSAPFTVTLHVRVFASAYTGGQGVGLFIEDGFTKFVTLYVINGGTPAAPELVGAHWSSLTSNAGNTFAQPIPAKSDYWLRLYDNGTTMYYQFSAEGAVWQTAYNESSGAYISTPVTVGVAAFNGCNTCLNSVADVWDFENVAGTGTNVTWQ